MLEYSLFSDVSVNPQKGLGVGACLLLPRQCLALNPDAIDREELSGLIRYRRFTATSSTKLELQTVLWGLDIYRDQIPPPVRGRLQLYTDSQCIVGLSSRRERLEGGAYRAGRSGRLLANAELYTDFYAAGDELGFEIVKLAGHSRAASHESLQLVFSLVDRGARRELKSWLALPKT